jgi:hypothetical protein
VDRPRPRRALRPTLAVRIAKVVVPAAFVAVTGTAVAAATWPGQQAQIAYPAPVSSASTSTSPSLTTQRSPDVSRDLPRPSLSPTPKASPTAKTKTKAKAAKAKVTPDPVPTPALDVAGSKYATVGLNIRTDPEMDSKVITVVPTGTKLSVTATVYKGFRFVSYMGKGRWVRNQYLSHKKPKPAKKSAGGISSAACKSGNRVESGLTRDAIRVHRALCARYPQISSFGGTRSGGGFHGSGQAVDAMISNSSVGWDAANWVRANAKRLGVSEVIYAQKIWTVQRSSEGWRGMSDRGSATANHYDHVHVSVYGNRGTG